MSLAINICCGHSALSITESCIKKRDFIRSFTLAKIIRFVGSISLLCVGDSKLDVTMYCVDVINKLVEVVIAGRDDEKYII